MFDSVTMWCFSIIADANIRDSQRAHAFETQLILEMYSSERARHNDADIIGREWGE